jgi:hypothetical protein
MHITLKEILESEKITDLLKKDLKIWDLTIDDIEPCLFNSNFALLTNSVKNQIYLVSFYYIDDRLLKIRNEADVKDETFYNLKVLNIKNINEHNGRVFLGYFCSTNHTGKGLTTALLNYYLQKFPKDNYSLLIQKDNIASIKVAEKCGFQLKKTYSDILYFELSA